MEVVCGSTTPVQGTATNLQLEEESTYHDVTGRDDEFRDHHVRYVGCGYVADGRAPMAGVPHKVVDSQEVRTTLNVLLDIDVRTIVIGVSECV